MYREFVIYEIENNDQIVEALQEIIKKKSKEIESLQETLSVPRMHFRYIVKLSADQIVK